MIGRPAIFFGGEGVPCRDVSKANEGVHEGQLARMIEFQAGDALAALGNIVG